MSIDELQAGHELDRLIAEKVMGRKVFQWGDPDDPFIASSRDAFDHACNCDTLTRFAHSEIGFCFTIQRYSTDIAAAWTVLERIYEIKGSWICVEKNCVDGDFNAGVVGDIGDPDWWMWHSNAKTAPLAICRAALKAVSDGENDPS